MRGRIPRDVGRADVKWPRTIRPHELERDDSRQVDHHLIEGAAGYLRVGGHDVSKPSVNVVSWSAVRIGPMIIVAPQVWRIVHTESICSGVVS